MSEEFASAGMPLDYPFAVQSSKEFYFKNTMNLHQNPELVYEYDLCRGNLFLLGSKEMTKDVKLGIIYTKFGRGYNKISDKKYQEFCVMQLV